MTVRRFITHLLIAAVMLAGSAGSASAATHVIVKLKPGASLQLVLGLLRGSLLDQVPDARTYLVSVPALPPLWLPLTGVEYLETNGTLTLPAVLEVGVLSGSWDTPAHWYAAQPSLGVVNAPEALAWARGRGVLVADIDSAFDYGHPSLAGHLTSGYDFVTRQETSGAGLDQSSAGFMFSESDSGWLDQSSAGFMFGDDGFLGQSSASFMFGEGGVLDQSSAGFMFEEGGVLDQSSAGFMFEEAGVDFVPGSVVRLLDPPNAAYSHGTFTAGLIAVTAPEAMIMPIRAFDENGEADLFTLTKAVRYAASNGAHVINMSWGTLANSKTLRAAIDFARGRGVILVASAGNMNSEGAVYPASWPGVMAVAATDDLDRRASFSNFGRHIWVDAPGVNIMSAYPGGRYGVSSGTSFSAPIVAGQAALIRSLQATGVELRIGGAAVDIDPANPAYAGKLGMGRVDLEKSVRSGGY